MTEWIDGDRKKVHHIILLKKKKTGRFDRLKELEIRKWVMQRSDRTNFLKGNDDDIIT